MDEQCVRCGKRKNAWEHLAQKNPTVEWHPYEPSDFPAQSSPNTSPSGVDQNSGNQGADEKDLATQGSVVPSGAKNAGEINNSAPATTEQVLTLSRKAAQQIFDDYARICGRILREHGHSKEGLEAARERAKAELAEIISSTMRPLVEELERLRQELAAEIELSNGRAERFEEQRKIASQLAELLRLAKKTLEDIERGRGDCEQQLCADIALEFRAFLEGKK